MQDIFVGGLYIIGFLLATYMAGEFDTMDFWASLIAGVAVLGVVYFPTTRAGLSLTRQPVAALPGRPAAHSSSRHSVSIRRQ
jgi:hypothetical protein